LYYQYNFSSNEVKSQSQTTLQDYAKASNQHNGSRPNQYTCMDKN